MTTPTGTISFSDLNNELGRGSTNGIDLNDGGVRGLAGVGSGQISMSQLRGKSNISFNPNPGDYFGGKSYAIYCNQNVVWNWSRDNSNRTSADPDNGGTSTRWSAAINYVGSPDYNYDNESHYTVYAVYNGVQYGPWHIDMYAPGNA